LNDFDLLPIDLRERSLSKNEIVLNYFDVFKAIEILRSNNWSILGWEAWIKYSNGKFGHPLPYVIGADMEMEKDGSMDFIRR
jgi:hypothetical protein